MMKATRSVTNKRAYQPARRRVQQSARFDKTRDENVVWILLWVLLALDLLITVGVYFATMDPTEGHILG